MKASLRYSDGYVRGKITRYRRKRRNAVVWFAIDLTIMCILIDRIILTNGDTLFSTSMLEKVLDGVIVICILLSPMFILMYGIMTYKLNRWRGYRKP